MKKAISATALIFILGLVGGSLYISFFEPDLSANTNDIIQETITSDLPEFINGKTGFAMHGNVKIWYEAMPPERTFRGTILLVMGISSDALTWPEHFIDPLRKAGFQVVRFDHRGLGLSDWMQNWRISDPYSLEEMAGDAIAVLNHLEIEKAHVVGVSMGGMIAQSMAIHYPQRVLSLTSIMSTGYYLDPQLPSFSKLLAFNIAKLGLKYWFKNSEEEAMKMRLAGRSLFRGSRLTDSETFDMCQKMLYDMRKRKGYNNPVGIQHFMAIVRSGSRYDGLRKIAIPTLIIHGKQDPLVPFAHGVKCAQAIPKADALWIEGLGHDLPAAFTPLMTQKIIAMLSKFDGFQERPGKS